MKRYTEIKGCKYFLAVYRRRMFFLWKKNSHGNATSGEISNFLSIFTFTRILFKNRRFNSNLSQAFREVKAKQTVSTTQI